jgi:hypothetical protein
MRGVIGCHDADDEWGKPATESDHAAADAEDYAAAQGEDHDAKVEHHGAEGQ